MNKKIITITILSIVTGLLILNLVKTKDSEVEKMPKQVKNTNMLTMMLETEAGTGSYEEVTQSEWPQDGYVFNASLSRCENGGTLSWDDNAKKIILNTDVSDKCYVYFDIYNEPTFAEYIINNVYTEDGVNGLYYHDGVGTYTNSSEEAGDNSYRYSGANPNNYVCFGSDTVTCPNDNLYRIIGLFDDDKDGIYNVKLIKNTSIGKYAWNSEHDNTWNSSINDWGNSSINGTLNTTFLNSLKVKWQNKIQNTSWVVGGNTDSNIYNVSAKNAYLNEIVPDENVETYNGKIGLMYVSDYGYAAAPSNWTTVLFDYNDVTNTNWLYLSDYEWTITRHGDTSHNIIANTLNINRKYKVEFLVGDPTNGLDQAFHISANGSVFVSYIETNEYNIRPAFYLNPDVILKTGTGSISDPFKINA